MNMMQQNQQQAQMPQQMMFGQQTYDPNQLQSFMDQLNQSNAQFQQQYGYVANEGMKN